MKALREQINLDIKEAMKRKDVLRLQALRLVSSDLKNREIEQKKPLQQAQVISLLQKHIKQYKESLQQYQKAGRSEGVKEQTAKLQIIQSYLPEPLSEKALLSLIDKALNTDTVRSAPQTGVLIREVRSHLPEGAVVDGSQLARLVKERLKNT